MCLSPEPCNPTNLSVHYNVSTAQVMWEAARGASSYSAEAVTNQGMTISCNTTNTGCFLNSLQCSQIYNVTVTASNVACNSVTSEIHCLMTGWWLEWENCTWKVYRWYGSGLFVHLIQNLAHQPTFKPVWSVNNMLQLFHGSRVTLLWVMLPTLTTKEDIAFPVLAQTQTYNVLSQDWCVELCTASGWRPWDSSTTALTAPWSLLHQVHY